MLRRWSELLKRFEMIVEVMEQNETGEYEPVELVEKVDNVTGGVFRLKQASRIDSPSICHFPFLSSGAVTTPSGCYQCRGKFWIWSDRF